MRELFSYLVHTMARQSQIRFSIPEPCNVPWNGMRPVDTDQRHCSSCAKVVTDFSKMSDDELMLYFRHNGGKICGRLSATQLNRPMRLLPDATSKAKWWRTLILIPLTLFGKTVKAQYFQAQHSIEQSKNPVQADTLPGTLAENLPGKKDSLAGDSTVKTGLTVADSDSLYKYVWNPNVISVAIDSLMYHPWEITTTGGTVEIITQPYVFSWVPWISVDSVFSLPKTDTAVVSETFKPADTLAEDKRSILAKLSDTLLPYRKKKKAVVALTQNTKEIKKQDAFREFSDHPPLPVKPAEPALPSNDEITAILQDQRKKQGYSA